MTVGYLIMLLVKRHNSGSYLRFIISDEALMLLVKRRNSGGYRQFMTSNEALVKRCNSGGYLRFMTSNEALVKRCNSGGYLRFMASNEALMLLVKRHNSGGYRQFITSDEALMLLVKRHNSGGYRCRHFHLQQFLWPHTFHFGTGFCGEAYLLAANSNCGFIRTADKDYRIHFLRKGNFLIPLHTEIIDP